MARPALFVIAAVTIACSRPAGYPASPDHPLYGKALPEIHHQTTLEGQPFDSTQLAGKPVLVKFFADFCVPCRETLPAAERIHESHPDVVFIGIDEDESADAAQSLAKRYGLTFAVVHDQDNVLSGRFRVSSLPTTFVADRTGVVRWVGADGQTEEDLKSAVETAARSP